MVTLTSAADNQTAEVKVTITVEGEDAESNDAAEA